ncbi:FAD-binding, type 2 [Akanthomyces lecanii RCEF 1005]|uniref:FAD-binding, type 2 n=1 Tax=Akanthomyces lecanii RCEF 1005 TaxID=1081108 RepID=A0A162K6M8_CORDF|nr:FAD-binding, type 2 [Akanthomyces lecanii RCEF 1005]
MPLASPCHGSKYNETECATLRDEWLLSTVHMNSPSSIMAPIFANQSCDPFQPRNGSCTLGNYVKYTVEVRNSADVVATVRFAAQHNIRLVIRNTGHDYNGRSTGAGALAVWTHSLKDTQVVDWKDDVYDGKALKVGAGVAGYEALAAAHKAGLVVLTGECPSVGIAGGYAQGGGHSALSTIHGLAADNALSYDVVTATGRYVTATRDRHQDLYWALSGGGGGNYGIVVSMVVRAHPDAMVSGAKFAVQASEDDPDRIFDVIDAYHAALPAIVDAGAMSIYFFGGGFLQSPATTFFNKTGEQAAAILQPFVDAAARLNVTVTPNITQHASYYDHYDHYWGPLPAGNIQVGTTLFGGRLIDRPALAGFSATARGLARANVTFIGVGLDVSKPSGGANSNSNAVLPQWRRSIVSASLTLPWSFAAPFADMVAAQDRITNEVQPLVEAATPGGGAYMNEADFQQPGFQDVFFGSNYGRLSGVKSAWDPDGLLYAISGVGSEQWEVRRDGRLCKVAGETAAQSKVAVNTPQFLTMPSV